MLPILLSFRTLTLHPPTGNSSFVTRLFNPLVIVVINLDSQ